MTKQIRVGHSPDSDDAFMFYGISTEAVSLKGYEITEVIEDIESLNKRAMKGELEVSAISINAYAFVAERYLLLSSGASMGEGYGPELISIRKTEPEEIKGRRIAIPGKMTSAYLAMKMFEPDFEAVEVPFDAVMAAVKDGTVDAGLIIHEGQLTFKDHGFNSIINLGTWWQNLTGLPLPLGGNAIRKDLGKKTIADVASVLKESIAYSLKHREKALGFAMKYARDLDQGRADRFVGMYVNERTLDYGADGRKAVQLFLDMAHEQELIPNKIEAEFTD